MCCAQQVREITRCRREKKAQQAEAVHSRQPRSRSATRTPHSEHAHFVAFSQSYATALPTYFHMQARWQSIVGGACRKMQRAAGSWRVRMCIRFNVCGYYARVDSIIGWTKASKESSASRRRKGQPGGRNKCSRSGRDSMQSIWRCWCELVAALLVFFSQI